MAHNTTRLGDIPPGAAHSPPDVSDRPQTRRGHYTHETKPSSRNPSRHLIRPRGGCVDPFDMTLPGSSSDRPRARARQGSRGPRLPAAPSAQE
ncbi:hypothetical protein CSOJ01_08516 [Colletotrichum sojae]|uniref:Uncharacterized protein n=1 Tax=Colletotrichum sojae TaxID=2175907 RepID=A0A8H6MRZ0_9PEZI|nr:hypothetical protein CSOJ01_08516 [Colletotrichum sojae]